MTSAESTLLKHLTLKVGLLEIALIAILIKASSEVRTEFAQSMNATLDIAEWNPKSEDAAALMEAAAALLHRVMPDLKGLSRIITPGHAQGMTAG